MTPPEAISQGDAATRLGISRATVERWLNQGRLNTIRTGERGGARRVLVDDAFHAAKIAARKIPHTPRRKTGKSLTPKNPSAADPIEIPHLPEGASTPLQSESLTEHMDEMAVAASSSTTSLESLTVASQESLTAETEKESLTSVDAPGAAGVTSPAPSEQRLRHPLDADLVPITHPPSAEPAAEIPSTLSPPWRRPGVRAAVAGLLAVVAAATALLVYQPRHQVPRAVTPPSAHAGVGARGAHAHTVQPAVAAAVRPRGGHALRLITSTSPAPAKTYTSRPPTPSPTSRVTQPTSTSTSRPHRQHPITPCQSSGICVPD